MADSKSDIQTTSQRAPSRSSIFSVGFGDGRPVDIAWSLGELFGA